MISLDFGEWKLVFGSDPGYMQERCVLWQNRADGRAAYFSFKTGICTILEGGERVPDDAFISLRPEILQGIMDGLWERGVRPKDRRYENELDLMKNHLEDMRRIALKGVP